MRSQGRQRKSQGTQPSTMASLTTLSESERIEVDGKPALERYITAGGDFVTREQATLLQMYGESGALEFTEMGKDRSHSEGLSEYINALLAVVSKITDLPVVRYLVSLLDTVTQAIQYTMAFGVPDPSLTTKFRRHLDGTDMFSAQKAAMVMGRFATIDLPKEQIQLHLGWICENLTGGPCTESALSSLMICLSKVSNRAALLSMNGLRLLVNVCKTCTADQAQRMYEACFCLWVLSFGDDEATMDFGRSGAIDILCSFASKSTPREKVTRVCVEALRNLVTKNDGEFCQMMLDPPNNLLMVTTGLLERHWGDSEISDSIKELRDVLQKNFKILTSFERYEKELNKGELIFGPVHTEKFWRDNCERFKKQDFLLIRTLVAVLRASVLSVPMDAEEGKGKGKKINSGTANSNSNSGTNGSNGNNDDSNKQQQQADHHLVSHFASPIGEETTAVACYDLGEFVRFFPAGKQISNTMGIKYLVMALLQHPSTMVQEKALASCTKMLLRNHQHMN